MKRRPSLLILNQMAGPLTWELAEDLGREFGPVALLTGHPDTLGKGSAPEVMMSRSIAYNRRGFASRIVTWIAYWIHAFFWLWRFPAKTPVLVFSNPPFLVWLGLVMFRLRGQKYAVMVHDIYPDILVRMGKFTELHPLVRVWREINRRAYDRASVVMTLGEQMAATLAQQIRFSDASRRVQVIYPWADTEKIRPIPKHENPFAIQYGQVGRLTIMYSGNMGLGHDLESICEAALQLRDRDDINFMFIGAGPKWQVVRRFIQQNDLKNAIVLPWQNEKVAPFAFATADIAVVTLESELSGIAIPSKYFSFLAAGAAVLAIAPGASEIARWTAKGCGAAIECSDVAGLMHHIRTWSSDRATLEIVRRTGRQAAMRTNRRSGSRRFIEQLAVHLQASEYTRG